MSSQENRRGGHHGTSKDDSGINNLTPSSKLARPRTGSLERLPSLRPKRDLTLGGVPKKTFTPTIPTTRRVKRDVSPSASLPDKKKQEDSPQSRRKTQDKRGRGRDRKRGKEVITSASVFSMGPAERTMERKRESISRGGGGGGGEGWSKPTVKRDKSNSENHKMLLERHDIDKDDEPMDTLSDDETTEDLFSNSRIPPIQLPLDYTLHTKHRTVLPKHVKVKQKPSEDQSDSVAAVKLVKPVVGPAAPVRQHQITAAELFTPTEESKGQFLFFQLPDCLPISCPPTRKEEEEPMEVTNQGGETSSSQNTKGESQRHCTLHDVPEGLIGKLRVHRSGKVKLSLGDVTLDVTMGTPCGFLQEMVSIRTDHDVPEMIVLGQLSHRLVSTPDFETMLSTKR